MAQEIKHLYEFGSFQIIPEEHLLTFQQQPVRIPLKTFELLLYLVQNHNQVISKETLLQKVWGETFVEEANLTVHISTLRKILAEDSEKSVKIETFPKKGYRFSAQVKEFAAGNGQPAPVPVELKESLPIQTGKFALKNNWKLIIISGLAVFIILAVWSYSRYSASNSSVVINSVAVLPFINQTGNPENEYLSDGMTETLIGSLSKLPNLSVKARSSVFRYKGKETDPQLVGNELSAQAILLGRISQRDENIILSLELVDSKTGNIIWSEQYSRKQTEIISLQKEIASNISNKIRAKLSGDDKQLVTKNYTESDEAYRLYLKGRFYWNRRTLEDFKKAITYFQQAIEADPDYALAYSGLSDSYNLFSMYGGAHPRDVMPSAKATALKALSLDQNLAEAHGSLGQYLANYQNDRTGAEQEFKRAIELNPNYAPAYQWYAELLEGEGRFDEALNQIRLALELDPLSRVTRNILGRILFLARRYNEAIEQFRKNIDLEPRWGGDHDWLFHIYAAQGRYPEAVEAFGQCFTLLKLMTPTEIQGLQERFAKSGWEGFLRHYLKYLEEKSKREYVRPFNLAEFYARLNEKDKAFAALNKSLESGSFVLGFFKYLPSFDNLRSDPRYHDLVRRAELQQQIATP